METKTVMVGAKGPIQYIPARPSDLDRFFDEILPLNYLQRRIAMAKRISGGKFPHFQYKYRAVPVTPAGDNAKIDHLREIIVKSQFWLSSPSDFNDPFDTTAQVVFEGTEQERDNKFQQLIADRSVGLNHRQRQEQRKQFAARPTGEWLESIKITVEKNRDNVGILSLTSAPRSIVMWGHYGDHHKGIVLQFDVARDPLTFTGALPVDYSADHPEYNWIRDQDGEQMRRMLKQKFDAWRYESEWRIIRPGCARTHIEFQPDALVGIVFGCNADAKVVDLVYGILAERKTAGLPTVQLMRAIKHDSQYRMNIHKVKTSGPGSNSFSA